jgi:superfamily II DNA helicase RecQ
MDIDCPNTSCVVQWGSTVTLEDYVQEISRGGQKDQAACAPFFFAPCDKVHIYSHNHVMVEYMLHSTFTELNLIAICVRVVLFVLKHVSVVDVMLFFLSLCTMNYVFQFL